MAGRGSGSKWQAVRFGELHIDDQHHILIEVLRLVVDSGLHSLRDIADDRGITPGELWRDICADAGLDACDPWPGFPDPPRILPDPRGDMLLTDEQPELAIAANGRGAAN